MRGNRVLHLISSSLLVCNFATVRIHLQFKSDISISDKAREDAASKEIFKHSEGTLAYNTERQMKLLHVSKR